MLRFFTAKTPKLCFSLKFTNFAATVLAFVGFCFATINISTADNVEIANFMVSESNRILQIPDSATLTINFQNAKDKHGRAWILFFWGEREVSIEANYTLAIPGREMLKGSLKADTSWYTGYCGMIECQSRPMPAQQRIETLKALVSKMLTGFNSKVYGVFVEKKETVDTSTPASITDSATDSTVVEAKEEASPDTSTTVKTAD